MAENSKPNQHVLRNNLLGIVAGAVVLGAFAKATDGGIMLVFSYFYLLQVVINLGIGLVQFFFPSPGRSAAPYFLSALLVLLIGFGACTTMMATLG
ncbi:hypothetical protein [Hymenobacter cellulosilyticus]|uniref:Uncharacterized protein n=1 Tax=Hymenobacter cellulosilyticus TaxID=2932248 RepID=A0A8T9Q0K9_9BACT|nr:hypothetical protein [Hymenobacter cellulosilyticus]UOQ71316.1 hypothetical protein MUN79_22200 [Hymenobacter cellulosilyticus]